MKSFFTWAIRQLHGRARQQRRAQWTSTFASSPAESIRNFSNCPWYISPSARLNIDQRFRGSSIPLCVALDIDNMPFPTGFPISSARNKIKSCFSRLHIKTDIHCITVYGNTSSIRSERLASMENDAMEVFHATGTDVADGLILTKVEEFANYLHGESGAVFISTGDGGFSKRVAAISSLSNIFLGLGLPVYSQRIPKNLYESPSVGFRFPYIYLGELEDCPNPPPPSVQQVGGGTVLLSDQVVNLLKIHRKIAVYDFTKLYTEQYGYELQFRDVKQLGGIGRCIALYIIHNMVGRAELFLDLSVPMKTISIRLSS